MTYFNSDPKPSPKQKPLFSSRTKKRKRVTGELELFRRIVLKRGARSQINNEPIHDITISSMMHVLSKKMYERFRLKEENILIVTPEQHRLWDQGSREELSKLPEWDFVFRMERELKEEYQKTEKE